MDKMASAKIRRIIAQGEGLTVEFKTAKAGLPVNLFETICAFLNRGGGTILLGVADDKTVVGVDPQKADAYCKDITNLSNNPQKLSSSFLLEVNTVHYKGKALIYIYVPASSQVHRCGGKVYDRRVDGDYEVKTDTQIRNIYTRKSAYYTEGIIYPYLEEAHFVKGIVKRARSIIRVHRPEHPWNVLSDKEFFIASGLYRRDLATAKKGFTLAALMLFGREEIIQSAVPHYKIDALLRREDTERYDDRENIRCNLIDAYDILMNFVAKHLPDKFFMESGQRVSLREKIFREIVANFLIHREYMNAYPATLIIYKDRVETKNANKPHTFGPLYPGKFEPFPKNPNMAKFFAQIGRAEELGTGIRRVFHYIKAYSGSERVEFLDEDLFVVKVPLVEGSQKSSQKILVLIRQNSGVTIDELAASLQLTDRAIKKNLAQMKKTGLLKRIGPDKGGHWEVSP